MRGCVVEGNISLELKNGSIVLLAKRDNKTLDEITIEDDQFRENLALAKELLGMTMQIIYELTKSKENVTDAIEEELCENWGSYEIIGG